MRNLFLGVMEIENPVAVIAVLVLCGLFALAFLYFVMRLGHHPKKHPVETKTEYVKRDASGFPGFIVAVVIIAVILFALSQC